MLGEAIPNASQLLQQKPSHLKHAVEYKNNTIPFKSDEKWRSNSLLYPSSQSMMSQQEEGSPMHQRSQRILCLMAHSKMPYWLVNLFFIPTLPSFPTSFSF
ncbi:hypothetical protein H4Q26_013439 [Puccinia striiformis f. sp. tritici PST-130]|nr:hypothetical protein H4Q26_013439 [Puccinia striiformis f. sp. tritici PST-130]